MEVNRDRFRENLEIIALAWKGEPFSYDGRFRTVRNVQVVPQPLQNPVPLFISVFSPPTLEWAAQQGYNVILAPFAAAANFGSMETALSHYRKEAVKHGHPNLEARCSYFVYVIDENESVSAQQHEAVEAMIRYFRTTAQDFPEGEVPEHMKYWLALRERLSSITPDMLNTNSVIFGTPSFCVEQFKRVEAAGISQVICYFDFGGLPKERVERNIRLFAEQVMPHISPTSR
jgi:alkanesulfonate monooxygenase SsuD/methylene tetrahydromethanopterin reductase-like flavin-dependent oxidoreductase (luciferase family)